jgi:hypothetical protein
MLLTMGYTHRVPGASPSLPAEERDFMIENREQLEPTDPRTEAPEEEGDDVDLVLRHVSRQFPEALVQALITTSAPVVVGGWIDTQVSGRQRRLDRTLEVTIGGRRCLLHVEWQLKMTAKVPFRVYEYNVLLSLAEADKTRAGGEPLRIESVVVLLGGREERWAAEGEYRTSWPEARFSGVRFRIEPVYQRTLAELMARESPLWLIFAPLAVDANEQSLPPVIEALRARTTARELEELGVAMAVLADADKRQRGLRSVITSLLPEEVVMESWIYKQGKQKGVEEGLEQGLEKGLGPLAHLFERRLARGLTSAERGVLVRRLGTLGPERLGDLVLDFTPEALAAWLAAPDAS